MTSNNTEILEGLFELMPEDERAVLCTIGGDPSTVERWPGIAWRLGSRCPLHPDANNYAAVSGFTADEKGSYRRRKDQFAALYAVMVDDIGTKIDVNRIPAKLIPTMLVQTSPGNYQATFKLATPIRDFVAADALIRALTVAVTGGGPDPGMSGVTRVLRLPFGINGKDKYRTNGQAWRCVLHAWDPRVTVTPEQLVTGFRAALAPRSFVEPDTVISAERKRGFQITLDCLRMLGLIKRQGRGWVDVTCPWVSEHTGRADTGSAIAYPDKANGWIGGYRCHHGHCEGRGWTDLESWTADRMVEHGRRTRGAYLGEM